jgi:TRAP-type C4-dicarboxylate transport system permease small subunit
MWAQMEGWFYLAMYATSTLLAILFLRKTLRQPSQILTGKKLKTA